MRRFLGLMGIPRFLKLHVPKSLMLRLRSFSHKACPLRSPTWMGPLIACSQASSFTILREQTRNELSRKFCVSFGRLYPINRQKTKDRGSFSQIQLKEQEEMLTLPKTIIHVLRQFEEVFRERVWEWAKVLLIGAILVPGERTVASILRVMGCSDEKQFQNYHRVLHRAKWSSRELSRRLLILLVRLFVPATAPVILGIDAHHRTPTRPHDCRTRRLSRSGSVEQGVFRENEWIALDLPDALDAHSVGLPCVGLAVFDGSGPIGTLSPGAPNAAQNDHGLGQTDDRASGSLGAGSTPGRGCRWDLCRAGFLAKSEPRAHGLRRHPLAPGCVFVRPCSSARDAHKRQTGAERETATQTGRATARSKP